MAIIPGINLPWPILLHALGLLALGLNQIFRRSPPGRVSELTTMLGISTTALALGYLCTAYVPLHQNVFLHASVPVRMLLGTIAGLKLFQVGSGISAAGKVELWTILLYDGFGGVALGWFLGGWGGRIPGAHWL
ncbi:hypothetical protein BS47DRAFT_143263 [Hydnum rufescens UP504]|uniref:Uncharacterized protein n=1 Tax=Hydnum rufescens UP504 TaxID=1448309 RepID=A0A9P6APN9_9AGAM|nr:hypothetical protein BS47DRAFT_143263 [Hydnum rufescens UP504]